MRIETVFLFDLDGTLVDSVYQHVLAWKTALDAENIELSVWRIHRKVGMSGGLFTNQLLRETGCDIDPERIELGELVQEPRLRRHRDERARIGEQDRLAQLAIPGPEAEPSAFVGGELETVAAHERDDHSRIN